MTAIAARSERTYLAGFGASGALIAAAAVAGLFLIALVAFNGWPAGGAAKIVDVRTEVQPAASKAASTALAPAPGAVTATPTPVVLAKAGNPNSVVTPGSPVGGGSPGTVGAPSSGGVSVSPLAPGQNTGSLGVAADAVDSTGPITRPLVNSVGQTVGTVTGVVTGLLPGSSQTLAGTGTSLGTTVNTTLVVLNGTVYALLKGGQTP